MEAPGSETPDTSEMPESPGPPDRESTATDVPRPTSGRRRRSLMVLVSCLCALLVLEVLARGAASLTDRGRGMGFHPDFGWRPIPHIVKKGAEWCAEVPAVINSRGFRDDELPFAKPEGERRIVSIGDSFTFGQGVDFGARFSERLEQRFEDVVVVNLGVCGYGTDQELRVFEVEGQRYQPDLVVLTVYLGNDLDDIRYERHHSWPKPWFRLEDSTLELVPPELDGLTRLRLASYVAEFTVAALESDASKNRKAEPWREGYSEPLFHALVARLRDAVRAADAELLVVFAHPPQAEVPGWSQGLMARVARDGGPEGATVLDTFPLFAGRAEEGEVYLPDGHWTPLGHQIVADAIAERLGARGWR